MTNDFRHNLHYPDEQISSARLVWFTVVVLIIGAALLIISYLGPRPISPSFRATENPSALSGR
jgi:hypothetical protein